MADEKNKLRAALSEKYFGGAFMMPSQRPTDREQCRHLLRTSLRPATPNVNPAVPDPSPAGFLHPSWNQPDVSLVQAALDRAFGSLDLVTRQEVAIRERVAARRAERGPSQAIRDFNEEHDRAMAALAAGPTPKSVSCISTKASPPDSAPRSVSIGYSGPPPSISKDAKTKKNKKRDLRTSYWKVKADFSGLDETTEDDIFHTPK